MVTLKTESAVMAYSILNTAKLRGIENNIKFELVKIVCKLKPVATAFEAFREDVQTRLRSENFDEMQQKAQEWQKQEQEGNVTLSEEERIAINKFFNEYANNVNACIKEEAEKNVDVDFNLLSEDAFNALIGANEDWSMEHIVTLREIIAE